MNDKCCYATVATKDEFIPCIIRNAQSIEHFNSKYPYIVLIPNKNNEYMKRELELNNIIYKEIEVLKFNYKKEYNYNDTINKFYMLTLTEFDKIYFLDADIILTKNLDSEFDKFDNKNKICQFYGKDRSINGALSFWRPDLKTFEEIIKLCKDEKYRYGTDEMVAMDYFQNDLDCLLSTPPETFHFQGFIKPWQHFFPRRFFNILFYTLSKEEYFYYLEEKDTIKSYWCEFKAFINKEKRGAYLIRVYTIEDLEKIHILQNKFIDYGISNPLIIAFQKKDEEILKIFAKMPKADKIFKIYNFNISDENKLLSDLLMDYDKICFINNLDIDLKDNLDCLFSDNLNEEFKNNLLNKYITDIKINKTRI